MGGTIQSNKSKRREGTKQIQGGILLGSLQFQENIPGCLVTQESS